MSSFDNSSEVGSNQSSAADQTTVNILFGEQFFCIAWFHGTAVLDGQSVSSSFAVKFCNNRTDEGTNFLCLICGCGFTGTDCPNWFVSDYDAGEFFFADTAQSNFCLESNYFFGDALFALLQNFADAQDYF